MAANRKRLYAKFERSTWRNPTFRYVLTDDARWMWVHLLTTPRASKCPGLIEASALNLMEDLGWDRRGVADDAPEHERIAQGVQRTNEALDELASTVRDDGVPWIIVSAEHRIIVVPRAVAHDLPANPNIVDHWLRALAEFPDTEIKRAWVKAAFSTLRTAFGNDDGRVVKLRSLHYSLARRLGAAGQDEGERSDDVSGSIEGRSKDVSTTIASRNGDSHPDDADTEGTTSDRQGTENTREHETVSPDESEPSAPEGDNGSRTINISNSISSKKARAASAARKQPRQHQRVIDETVKPTNPPTEFTDRQVAFYRALQEAEYYVRGKGIMTAFEAVPDPVRLARNLGDADTFPLIDAGLVKRLGAWTLENRSRAKVDIAKFILNRARYSQERGHPRRDSAQQDRPYQHGGDLAAKVNATRKK